MWVCMILGISIRQAGEGESDQLHKVCLHVDLIDMMRSAREVASCELSKFDTE